MKGEVKWLDAIISGIVSLIYFGLCALSLIWYIKYNNDCAVCNVSMISMVFMYLICADNADNFEAAFRCATLGSLGANAIWLSAIDPIVGTLPILFMLWHYVRRSVKNGVLNATIGWLTFLTMVAIVIIMWLT